jgi:hypothetical protein
LGEDYEVVVLTINGVLVHKLVLPTLKRSIGKRLFDNVSTKRMAGMTFLGSVSIVSWVLPFVLAKASALNYVTPMTTLLAVYLACILAVWISLFSVMRGVATIQRIAAASASHELRPAAMKTVRAIEPGQARPGAGRAGPIAAVVDEYSPARLRR